MVTDETLAGLEVILDDSVGLSVNRLQLPRCCHLCDVVDLDLLVRAIVNELFAFRALAELIPKKFLSEVSRQSFGASADELLLLSAEELLGFLFQMVVLWFENQKYLLKLRNPWRQHADQPEGVLFLGGGDCRDIEAPMESVEL